MHTQEKIFKNTSSFFRILCYTHSCDADMAELVDALISGVSGETRAGSTPVIRTMKKDAHASFFVFIRLFRESAL